MLDRYVACTHFKNVIVHGDTRTYKRIIIYIKVKLVFVVVVLSVWACWQQRNAHEAMTKERKNYVYHI